MSCDPSAGVRLLAVLTTPTVATLAELMVALAFVTPLGLAVVCVSVTVLAMAPAVVTVATMVKVAVVPLVSVPTVQVRVGDVKEAVPVAVELETYVMPAGRWSVRVTPAAESGPLFVAVRV